MRWTGYMSMLIYATSMVLPVVLDDGIGTLGYELAFASITGTLHSIGEPLSLLSVMVWSGLAANLLFLAAFFCFLLAEQTRRPKTYLVSFVTSVVAVGFGLPTGILLFHNMVLFPHVGFFAWIAAPALLTCAAFALRQPTHVAVGRGFEVRASSAPSREA